MNHDEISAHIAALLSCESALYKAMYFTKWKGGIEVRVLTTDAIQLLGCVVLEEQLSSLHTELLEADTALNAMADAAADLQDIVDRQVAELGKANLEIERLHGEPQ